MSKNDLVPYTGNLPTLSREVQDCLPHLPAHRRSEFLDLFRSDTRLMQLDADFVYERGRYLDARINEVQKVRTLVQEYTGASADIADIENQLIEIQRSKDHERWMSELKRNAERVEISYDHRITVKNKETELARAEERLVRARRNVDAAERMAPGQVDQWYAEQEARKSNAFAERQDALADLAQGRVPAVDPRAAADAAARQRDEALALIENELELQRSRGNSAGGDGVGKPPRTVAGSIMRRDQTTTRAAYAAKYPALARRRQPVLALPQRDFTRIPIGHDERGNVVRLHVQTLMRHLRALGTTGSGKTTFLKNLLIEWVRLGYGGVFFDPHGSHPGSLLNEIAEVLDRAGFFASGRVHCVDLNVTSHITPFNFIGLEDTDLSVTADAFLEAMSVAFKGEDLYAKPTIRNRTRTLIMALADLGLPLADAELFLDPFDRAGVRARSIERITNPYAKEGMQQLHFISEERSKRDFRAEVVGPCNRLAEFLSCEAVRMMLGVVDEPGKPRRTLDVLRGMEQGHIYLINLQHGRAISEANAALVGALLFRYVFLLASRRTNLEPFLIVADEFQKIASGDLPNLLAEARKFSVGCVLSHQYLAAAGHPRRHPLSSAHALRRHRGRLPNDGSARGTGDGGARAAAQP